MPPFPRLAEASGSPLTSSLLAARLGDAHGQRGIVQPLSGLALPVLHRPAYSTGALLVLRRVRRATGPGRDRCGHILSGAALRHRGVHCCSVACHQSELVILRQGRLGKGAN